MNIPLIVTQEQNATFLLKTLTEQSDNHFEDNKHFLHIIYNQQEFIISPKQSKDVNILRGVMLSIIMTKSGFSKKFEEMLTDKNLNLTNIKKE